MIAVVKDKANTILDAHFGNEFIVREVPGEDFTKRGIDRTFIHQATRFCWGVKYQIDPRKLAGNAIIPLWKTGVKQRGWIFTSHAQVLVYYIPEMELAYLCYTSQLKHQFSIWSNETVYNDGKVVKVPLKLFSEASYKQERIPWETTQ